MHTSLKMSVCLSSFCLPISNYMTMVMLLKGALWLQLCNLA